MCSTEQVIVPAEESVPRDRLSGLPNEILLEIFPRLDTWIDSLNLSKASTRCHEFGAPLDSPLELTRWDDYPGARPLIFAIRHYQLAAVEWLLAHGADPSDPNIFQEAPSRWMVLSLLQIARELPEESTIPEEEEHDSDDIISHDSDHSIEDDYDDSIEDDYDHSISGISASPPSLSRWIRGPSRHAKIQ
ncbi:hypothetical protein MRS44_011323 [Fusarium solani]|uniref:uncharacterized protein n=1 Tax=Fusarium solani TaxID=169388 RepID=UPI0032C3E867|nr:hypothetical protein MRS44_011323 [Fusarium solani]